MAISPRVRIGPGSEATNFQHIPEVCVYSFDLDGNVIEMNAAMAGVLGYAREEAARMNLGQLLDPESLEEIPRPNTGATGGRRPAADGYDRDRQGWQPGAAGGGAAVVVRTGASR